jgi:hypothetical protein
MWTRLCLSAAARRAAELADMLRYLDANIAAGIAELRFREARRARDEAERPAVVRGLQR